MIKCAYHGWLSMTSSEGPLLVKPRAPPTLNPPLAVARQEICGCTSVNSRRDLATPRLCTHRCSQIRDQLNLPVLIFAQFLLLWSVSKHSPFCLRVRFRSTPIFERLQNYANARTIRPITVFSSCQHKIFNCTVLGNSWQDIEKLITYSTIFSIVTHPTGFRQQDQRFALLGVSCINQCGKFFASKYARAVLN